MLLLLFAGVGAPATVPEEEEPAIQLDYNAFGAIRPQGVRILTSTPIIRHPRTIRIRSAPPWLG